MAEAERIPPETVRQKVENGSALLVCAYDDQEKCRNNHLEDAIFYNEFTSRLPSTPKDREIIFYCA